MHRMIKRKNLFALLFAVLLALPMCAILGRVLYTQCNKNAKDSYSDKYITNVLKLDSTNSTLIQNGYSYIFNGIHTSSMIGSTGWYIMYKFTWSSATINIRDKYNLNYDVDGIGIATDANYLLYYRLYFRNALTEEYTLYDLIYNDSTKGKDFYTLNFNFTLATFEGNIYQPYDLNYYIEVNNGLDNAFEYSVNRFIQDNNFGNLDFFQWFDDMFLDSNNSVNNMYVHFVNWYLNYALLISLAYILFLVLMWFINYVRKLLERGMDFGEGSY